MDKQVCECGHEFSRDEHNHCPACGTMPGDWRDAQSTCEYKTNSRGGHAFAAKEDSEGNRTSLAETDAVKKTEAEIRRIKT